MNALPWILFSAAAAAICLVLLAMLAVEHLHRRRRTNNAALSDCYLRLMMTALLSEETVEWQIPKLNQPGARRLLVETIGLVMCSTYGLDSRTLRQIVEREGLEEWLLRRIRRTRGYRRAGWLALLSGLPVGVEIAAEVSPYAASRNREVRFQTLLVQVAADPSRALRSLAEYPDLLSAGEVAALLTLLRRGMLPIAYEPLLESENANLKRIGLGIVRQFAVEEAEPLLAELALDPAAGLLGFEALYTLCALRHTVSGDEVSARLVALPTARRKALLRYLAAEGYSARELHRLFGECERPYCEALVQSYKRMLV